MPAAALLIDGHWATSIIGDRFTNTLYVYAEGALYRSKDDGQTWTLVTSRPPVTDFIVNPFDPNVLYSGKPVPCADNTDADNAVLKTRPIFKSTDGGKMWFAIPFTENLQPLLSHALNPDTLIAANCAGLSISIDGGYNWETKPDTSAAALWERYIIKKVAAVFLAGEAGSQVLSWDTIYAGGMASDGSGVVAYSRDSGSAWTRLTPNVFPSPWGLSAMTVDPFNAGRLWFADTKGVWYSDDNGETWMFSASGLDNVVDKGIPGAPFGLNTLVYHPNDQIYLGTVRGLYTKASDAMTWRKVANSDYDLLSINDIIFTETNPAQLYLATEAGVYLLRVEIE